MRIFTAKCRFPRVYYACRNPCEQVATSHIMKKYNVSIKTVAGEFEKITMGEGNYSTEYGNGVISFEDCEDAANSLTKIILADNMVSVERKAEVSSFMIFEEGKSGIAEIATEFGNFKFPFFTKKVQTEKTDGGINVTLNYLSGENSGADEFFIHIKCTEVV